MRSNPSVQKNCLSFGVAAIRKATTGCLIAAIRIYQWTLSPFLGHHCRFHPTCSRYAVEQLQTQPFFKALFRILKRLSHCHPFHPGGNDPVIHPSRSR